MTRALGIELPVDDVARAKSFYRELLGISNREASALPFVFRQERSSRHQPMPALTEPMPAAKPQPSFHIDVAGRLEQALVVAWERGGRIVESARRVGRGVRRALILDTEGNLIALYSAATS
jgi:uncharacterized protein